MYSPKRLLGLFVLVFLVLAGCSEKAVDISPVPALTLLSVQPTNIQQFRDTAYFTIKYRDGDGDLGTSAPDTMNLWVVDTRLSLSTGYRIPQQAPLGTAIAIEGTLVVPLTRIPLKDSTLVSESAVFELYCRDRAGRVSNRLTSPAIMVRK
jgi:hypothetical protein